MRVWKKKYIDAFTAGGFVSSLSLIIKQEGHDGPEIAHLSLLTKHAPSSFPVT